MLTGIESLQENIEEYYCKRILKFTYMNIWKVKLKFCTANLEQK